MPTKLSIVISNFLIVLSFAACKETKVTTEPAPEKEVLEIAPKDVETFEVYRVNVNDLRMRQGEKKSSDVIDKLREGILIRSNGDVSAKKESVTLRGIKYTEPYRKVMYGEKEGWVYGGGLELICSQLSSISDQNDLDYFLNSISNTEGEPLEAGSRILQTIRKNNRESTDWNDMMYLLGEYYIGTISNDERLWQRLEKRQWTPEEYKAAYDLNFDMNSNPLAQKYALAGFKFDAGEGMVFSMPDPEVLMKFVSNPVSQSVADYHKIRVQMANEKIFSDAALVGSHTQLVDQIVAIEQFVAKYPDFPKNKNLLSDLEYMHNALKYGVSNTPALSDDRSEANEGWVEGWIQYLAKMPNGMLSNELKTMVDKYQK